MNKTLSVIALMFAVGAAPALAQGRPAAPPPGGPGFSCQTPKGQNSAECKPQPPQKAGAPKGPAKPGKPAPQPQPSKVHPAPGKAPQIQPAPHHVGPGKPHHAKPEPIRIRIGDKVDHRFKRHQPKSAKLPRGYDYYELGDKLFRVDPQTRKILAVVGLIEAFSR